MDNNLVECFDVCFSLNRTRICPEKRASETVELDDDGDPVGRTGHAQWPSDCKCRCCCCHFVFYSSLFPLRKRLTEMSRSRKTGSFDGRHSNSLSTILNVAGAVWWACRHCFDWWLVDLADRLYHKLSCPAIREKRRRMDWNHLTGLLIVDSICAGIQSVLHDESGNSDRVLGLAGGGSQPVDDHQRLDAAHNLHDPRPGRDERRRWSVVDSRSGQDSTRRAQSTDGTESHRRFGHFGFARMGTTSSHGRKCQQLRTLLERHVHQSTCIFLSFFLKKFWWDDLFLFFHSSSIRRNIIGLCPSVKRMSSTASNPTRSITFGWRPNRNAAKGPPHRRFPYELTNTVSLSFWIIFFFFLF